MVSITMNGASHNCATITNRNELVNTVRWRSSLIIRITDIHLRPDGVFRTAISARYFTVFQKLLCQDTQELPSPNINVSYDMEH